MESILTSIKKLLGYDEHYSAFDHDIIIHINTVFNFLNQLGVGTDGFVITDNTATWSEFIGDNTKIEMVKTYVYLKVKKIFDPALTGTVANAEAEIIKELEWRLNVAVDPGES